MRGGLPSAAMKIDGPLYSTSLRDLPALAARQKEAGYDGLFTFDGPYDPFLPLATLAHGSDVDLATGVAIAFARTPMTVAQVAYDLQAASGGRFMLGLGSQVKAHVERRFSMPWGKPVARMKDFVAALRAIFQAFDSGAPLAHEGPYYTHTMLPPMMKQAKCKFGPPPILVAGVGRPMLEATGEVADGYVVHPFHSPKYLDTFAFPALDRGLAARGKGRDGFTIVAQVSVVTGEDADERKRVREMVRHQLGFYASTPAYAPVLETEGFPELCEELRQLTKQGRWFELGGRVPDALLAACVVEGEPEECADLLRARYGAFAARVAIGTPTPLSLGASKRLVARFKAGQ